MIPVTTGDSLYVYGSFGQQIDYTARLSLKLADSIDPEMLQEAVGKTQQRYPYLSVRLMKNDTGYYYEENPEPVTLHHTSEKICLNSPETNYHIWAVCYNEDWMYLDIYHGLCDGTGMYMLVSTLLYYYCQARYGVSDHTGIRTLEDPILPEESMDPSDFLPQLPPEMLKMPTFPPVFSLVVDGGLTPSEAVIYDIVIPEDAVMQFASENDASPGTMVSILMLRAIDRLSPFSFKPKSNTYAVNARPMLGALQTHHNCTNSVFFMFDPIRDKSFSEQCTVHRGATFVQSDAEKIRGLMTVSASQNRAVKDAPMPLEEKKQIFAKTMALGNTLFTNMVSYIGQWKFTSLSPYISEFWTHVPCNGFPVTEIAAVNGSVFLSVHQNFAEDSLIKALQQELDEIGISYQVKPPVKSDIAHFPEP